MADNRAVKYAGPGKVEVQDIAFPGLELTDGPGVNPANVGRKCEHGVILKVVSILRTLELFQIEREKLRQKSVLLILR